MSLAQAAVRDGFDLTRREWSLLANAAGGWIQITNLILTGLMVVAAAAGYRRAMGSGVGRRWVPALLAVYGVSLVAAGVFRAGSYGRLPARYARWSAGRLHVARSAAHRGRRHRIPGADHRHFVLARRFRREGRPGRAVGSIVTGVAFLTAIAAIASGATAPAINLAFTAAVLLSWAGRLGDRTDAVAA